MEGRGRISILGQEILEETRSHGCHTIALPCKLRITPQTFASVQNV